MKLIASGLLVLGLRRMMLLSPAIYFAVLSALVTAGFLIGAFEGVGHARLVAMMFAVSLGLLIAALVELTREILYLHGDDGSPMIAGVP